MLLLFEARQSQNFFFYFFGLPDQLPTHPSFTPAQITNKAEASSSIAMNDFI